MEKLYLGFRKTILLVLVMISPVIFLLAFKNSVKALENINTQYIIIDPGHGGIDGGGVSYDGVYEKEINLRVSYYLKSYLENSGYNVKMTRYKDYDLASKNSKNRKSEDINKRLDIINNQNNILYISIHCNIFTDNSINGAQTFYKACNDQNGLLAKCIQSKLNTILKNTTRQSKNIEGKFLIDNATTSGCLVELGFLSNKTELELLKNKDYQDKIAYCIYIGIIDFLGKNNNF